MPPPAAKLAFNAVAKASARALPIQAEWLRPRPEIDSFVTKPVLFASRAGLPA